MRFLRLGAAGPPSSPPALMMPSVVFRMPPSWGSSSSSKNCAALSRLAEDRRSRLKASTLLFGELALVVMLLMLLLFCAALAPLRFIVAVCGGCTGAVNWGRLSSCRGLKLRPVLCRSLHCDRAGARVRGAGRIDKVSQPHENVKSKPETSRWCDQLFPKTIRPWTTILIPTQTYC